MDFDAGPVFNTATMKDIIYPLAVAVMGAVTAGVSWRTFVRSKKTDRERRIREINVLANKIIQSWFNLEAIGTDLKEAFKIAFVVGYQYYDAAQLSEPIDVTQQRHDMLTQVQDSVNYYCKNSTRRSSSMQVTPTMMIEQQPQACSRP